MNFFAFLISTHRSTSSCSTPLNSGNSERIALPPSATNLSIVAPRVGLAEIPEKPSEPPHSSPIVSFDKGVFSLFISFAFLIPFRESFIIFLIKSSLFPIFCWSNTNRGLSKSGFIDLRSSKNNST